MKHVVPHDLPLDLAKKAADKALHAYRERFPEYDPQVSWKTDKDAEVSFRAKGLSIKGAFEILADGISIDMDVPLLLRPFKGKALEVIEEQIKHWVEKAKRGEL